MARNPDGREKVTERDRTDHPSVDRNQQDDGGGAAVTVTYAAEPDRVAGQTMLRSRLEIQVKGPPTNRLVACDGPRSTPARFSTTICSPRFTPSTPFARAGAGNGRSARSPRRLRWRVTQSSPAHQPCE
jgi:hypothetical protein